ncbi:SDR family NAD(P)-dependent oxidoreductase [Sphingomonas ginsenosidivorax]|uniref:SDR family NAD(P)-dependent oxidoreductase n=1 Tax=Sphingomonas ginsenosidivorax TaxID=862135 RepID=A0A5C6UE39_9SPHN|nr:SDR family NAD(P)-dependent oxidoreductase [Sphingomonas ginsenosidivorax]TXC71002.1 SDR family NAD(P)-dependent oxidoreductase [Sphingomonas ginsenosidivorax]
MSRLDGERIVLTGIAGGIGSLVAQRLRDAGAFVIGVDRFESDLADEMLIADLGSFEGLAKLGDELQVREVDGLINLAGIQYFGPFADQSPETVWGGYVINLVAPAMLTRALMPRFKARGSGRIVNIGSVFGAIPFAHFVTYSSAKAGLKGFSDALRREYAGTDVSITHIAPRAVRTALNSPKVLAFADATKMAMDAPEFVADRIVAAVVSRSRNVVIGFPESLFVRVNALMPRVVDQALAANDRKAAALFV